MCELNPVNLHQYLIMAAFCRGNFFFNGCQPHPNIFWIGLESHFSHFHIFTKDQLRIFDICDVINLQLNERPWMHHRMVIFNVLSWMEANKTAFIVSSSLPASSWAQLTAGQFIPGPHRDTHIHSYKTLEKINKHLFRSLLVLCVCNHTFNRTSVKCKTYQRELLRLLTKLCRLTSSLLDADRCSHWKQTLSLDVLPSESMS